MAASKAGVDYSERLSDTSRALRSRFVQWVSDLAEQHHQGLAWWMTWLAGRNVMATQLFLHLCYLEVLCQLARDTDKDDSLLVLCEDSFLLRAAALRLVADGVPFRQAKGARWGELSDWAKWLIRIPALWLREFAWLARMRFAMRCAEGHQRPDGDVKNEHGARKIIMIHSCLDSAAFRDDGTVVDRYFTSLPASLLLQGYRVVRVPWLFNISRLCDAHSRLRHPNAGEWLIPEENLQVSDYFWVVRQGLAVWRVLHGAELFGVFNIAPLVLRERLLNISNASTLRFLRIAPALRRWIQKNGDVAAWIDTFENMPYERPAIWLRRIHKSNCRLVGYYHSLISSDFLAYHFTRSEVSNGLLPDIVITNGKLANAILERQGFPSDRLREGPALRQEYFRKDILPSISRRREVLVVFSMDSDVSAEVLRALLDMAQELDARGVTVKLKSHPMSPRRAVLTLCGMPSLPKGWSWAEGELPVHLETAQVVVGSGTASLMDAAAMGCPVIPVMRSRGLMSNSLDHWCDDFPAVRTIPLRHFSERLWEIFDDPHRAMLEALAFSDFLRKGLGSMEDTSCRVFAEA